MFDKILGFQRLLDTQTLKSPFRVNYNLSKNTELASNLICGPAAEFIED